MNWFDWLVFAALVAQRIEAWFVLRRLNLLQG